MKWQSILWMNGKEIPGKIWDNEQDALDAVKAFNEACLLNNVSDTEMRAYYIQVN